MRIPCLLVALSVTAVRGVATEHNAFKVLEPTHAVQVDAQGCKLQIHVDGLRNSTGVVGTVIFTSSDGWPENIRKAYRSWPTGIKPGDRQVMVVSEGIPPGDYGVVVLHDENSNMKLDRNIFGWPKEGFGFANNPHIGLGPPPFHDALLHIACPVTQTTIHMIYK